MITNSVSTASKTGSKTGREVKIEVKSKFTIEKISRRIRKNLRTVLHVAVRVQLLGVEKIGDQGVYLKKTAQLRVVASGPVVVEAVAGFVALAREAASGFVAQQDRPPVGALHGAKLPKGVIGEALKHRAPLIGDD